MTKLKRAVGFIGLIAVGVGIILGAGIYALVGKGAAYAGNMIWFSFLLASIIALFTGLSYAELSSKFPKAGGSYSFVLRIFNRKLAFVVGFGMILVGLLTSATLALAFGGYISSLVSVPLITSAILLVLAISIINYIGIKQTVGFNIVATAIETAGLILIIFVSAKFIGSVNYFELPALGVMGIFGAIGVIFFAFLGFEDVVNLAEETKHVKKLMPLALIISMVATTLLYVLVSASAISVVPYSQLAQSSAPLTEVFQKATGFQAGKFFSIAALVSIFNTVLLVFLAATRVIYSMALTKELPFGLSVLGKRKTPYVAIAVLALATIVFCFIKNITLVAQLTDIVVLIVFIIINVTVIKLRYSDVHVKGFTVPLRIGKMPVLPLLGALTSLFILITTIMHVLKLY